MGIVDFHSAPYNFLVEAVTKVYKANIVAVETCGPDEDGNINVGVLGTNFTPNIIRDDCVKMRIAVINKSMPRANGADSLVKVPISMFDYIIENDHEIPALPATEPTEFDKQLAGHILPYIQDGDSIQIGMGGLGNEIAKELMYKKGYPYLLEISEHDAWIGCLAGWRGLVIKAHRNEGWRSSRDFRGAYKWLVRVTARRSCEAAMVEREHSLPCG
jgi:4-hydroxybutyrate CoA-transferase